MQLIKQSPISTRGSNATRLQNSFLCIKYVILLADRILSYYSSMSIHAHIMCKLKSTRNIFDGVAAAAAAAAAATSDVFVAMMRMCILNFSTVKKVRIFW
jgi:hypothetical protein